MKVQDDKFPFLFSGKFGNFQGRVVNGKQILVQKRGPRLSGFSLRELQARKNFGITVAFLKPILAVIRKYNGPETHQDGYHKAMSQILRNAVEGSHPNQRINCSRVILGEGKLPNPCKYKVESPAKGLLEFTWSSEVLKRKVAKSDQIFAVAYCEANHHFLYELSGSERRDRQFLMNISSFSGQKVEVWFGFKSTNGPLISTSIYAGSVNVL